jgi:hypothetical protein
MTDILEIAISVDSQISEIPKCSAKKRPCNPPSPAFRIALMAHRVELNRSTRIRIRHEQFAREYLANNRNATKAAKAMGMSSKTSNALNLRAHEELHQPQVQMIIQEETAKRLERLKVTGDDIARYWLNLATADARELSPITRAACRHCHGIDFQYQFTLAEFRLARGAHIAKQMKLPPKQRKEFDELGGTGYDKTKPPNPDCPECNGQGITISRPIDLDKLSEGAAMLFDGVRQHRDGSIEIKVRDRSRAMEQFGYLVGLAPRPGASINFAQINELNIEKLSDDQLDALLARLALSMSPEERPVQTALEDLRDVTPGDNDL